VQEEFLARKQSTTHQVRQVRTSEVDHKHTPSSGTKHMYTLDLIVQPLCRHRTKKKPKRLTPSARAIPTAENQIAKTRRRRRCPIVPDTPSPLASLIHWQVASKMLFAPIPMSALPEPPWQRESAAQPPLTQCLSG
jgi:hypothetical protein